MTGPAPGARRAAIVLAGLALALPGPVPGAAQTAAGQAARGGDASAWSFGVGEQAVYDVTVALGSVRAPRPLGQARLTVEARDTLDGTPAYRASLEVEGGIPLVYRMDDRQVSWIGTDPLRTLRYEEHLRQGSYRRDRVYRMDQARGTYTRYDSVEGEWRPVEKESGVAMPEAALDEISFLYLVRTLPLEPGRSWTFERFFEEDGNPVRLEVVRREEIRVPAGRFETVVVRPTIRAGGLFGEEGRAEVWISDDDRRVVVKIESSMKAGRANFVLTGYRPGDRPEPATASR